MHLIFFLWLNGVIEVAAFDFENEMRGKNACAAAEDPDG